MDLMVTKISCKGLSNFQEGKLSIDFVASKRALRDEVDEGVVTHLFGNVHKLNAIAFTGINATGKTTALTILSELMDVLVDNGSLKPQMRIADYFKDALDVETHFFQRSTNKLFKLASRIEKGKGGTLWFSNESLWSKPATPAVSRVALFDYDGDPVMERNSVSDGFLKKEDSIFSSVLNTYDSFGRNAPGSKVCDLRGNTNRNHLSHLNFNLAIPFVKYLDSSVEDFRLDQEVSESSGSIVFSIKFANSDAPVFVRFEDLGLYLSSGTIKGLNCLSSIAQVFSTGGYLFVDEIENHLNKTIVINLIRLFASTVNANGATLVFSTHYSEILDSMDRSDGIYLFEKKEKMLVRKFSDAAEKRDRKDKKRSDLILSGVLNAAPSYRAYRDMVAALKGWLNDLEA